MILRTTLASLVSFVLAGALARAQSAPPPQASDLQAFHRSGQTFLTWSEVALEGESYRVYRSLDGPIHDLAGATLLHEVAEDSAEFFADRIQQSNVYGPDEARYAKRLVVRDDGPELAPGTGVLVWTLGAADFDGESPCSAWYAVTTVSQEGVENVSELSTANATETALAESIADPAPVRLASDPRNPNDPRVRIYVQYMDLRHWNPTLHAPNESNRYWGELDGAIEGAPLPPRLARAEQYAYAYKVALPNPELCASTPSPWPVVLRLHPHSGNRLARSFSYSPWCAIEIAPIDVGDTWWFGYSAQHDYRAGGVPTSGAIANFTELRLLRMLHDLLRDPDLGPVADRERVYVVGHSMGGSGAVALATRYPNVFAAAHGSKAMTDFEDYYVHGPLPGHDYADELVRLWGAPSSNLPVRLEFAGPSSWSKPIAKYQGAGISAWAWQNHQRQIATRVHDEMVPFGINHSWRDNTIPWQGQGFRAYASFNSGRRCYGGWFDSSPHVSATLRGLTAGIGVLDGAPFDDLRFTIRETVPGLSASVFTPPTPPQPPYTPGGYNLEIEWRTASTASWGAPPIDAPGRWAISLRTLGSKDLTVDVTPRRVHRFKLRPKGQYVWENRAGGGTIASGTATADALGLLTIRGVEVAAGREHRLVVRPASARVKPSGTAATPALAGS